MQDNSFYFSVNCEANGDADITVTYAVVHSKCWDIADAAAEAKSVSR